MGAVVTTFPSVPPSTAVHRTRRGRRCDSRSGLRTVSRSETGSSVLEERLDHLPDLPGLPGNVRDLNSRVVVKS